MAVDGAKSSKSKKRAVETESTKPDTKTSKKLKGETGKAAPAPATENKAEKKAKENKAEEKSKATEKKKEEKPTKVCFYSQ